MISAKFLECATCLRQIAQFYQSDTAITPYFVNRIASDLGDSWRDQVFSGEPMRLRKAGPRWNWLRPFGRASQQFQANAEATFGLLSQAYDIASNGSDRCYLLLLRTAVAVRANWKNVDLKELVQSATEFNAPTEEAFDRLLGTADLCYCLGNEHAGELLLEHVLRLIGRGYEVRSSINSCYHRLFTFVVSHIGEQTECAVFKDRNLVERLARLYFIYLAASAIRRQQSIGAPDIEIGVGMDSLNRKLNLDRRLLNQLQGACWGDYVADTVLVAGALALNSPTMTHLNVMHLFEALLRDTSSILSIELRRTRADIVQMERELQSFAGTMLSPVGDIVRMLAGGWSGPPIAKHVTSDGIKISKHAPCGFSGMAQTQILKKVVSHRAIEEFYTTRVSNGKQVLRSLRDSIGNEVK